MSYFNANVTGGAGGSAGGLVTKFEKTVAISSAELAEVVVNLADDISNYGDITNEQIIVELVSASAIASGDATLSHTYNAETGDLTITSSNSSIPFASNVEIKIDLIIYVAGVVQIPPAPEYSYELESPFVWTSNFKYQGYEQGGGFLEIPIMISGNYMVSAINAGGSSASVTYNDTGMVIGTPVHINAGEMIKCNWSKNNTGASQVGSFTFMATFD